MGMFDTFTDLERNRASQSKAFNNLMMDYIHDEEISDVVNFVPSNDENINTAMFNSMRNYRTFYVQTMTPCYFIRIEGNMFTGIVSTKEDRIISYPTYDYYGNSLKLTPELLEAYDALAEMSEIIETEADHLPMKQLRGKYDILEYHVINRISKQYSANEMIY